MYSALIRHIEEYVVRWDGSSVVYFRIIKVSRMSMNRVRGGSEILLSTIRRPDLHGQPVWTACMHCAKGEWN